MTEQEIINDLAATVKQLAVALRHASPGCDLPNKAFDALRKHNILPKSGTHHEHKSWQSRSQQR